MPDEYTTEGTPEYIIRLFPAAFTGICVEIGAADPFIISNSWLFEKSGWDTYCIEPNPYQIHRLRQYRKNVLGCACGSKNEDNVDLFVFSSANETAGTGLIDHTKNLMYGRYYKITFVRIEKVNVRTFDWLMENEIKKDHIDYLSIDVERNEIDVLKGIDLFRWKPKVIAIENLDGIQDQKNFLKSKNYRQVHRIIYNDIYVDENYYHSVVVPLGV